MSFKKQGAIFFSGGLDFQSLSPNDKNASQIPMTDQWDNCIFTSNCHNNHLNSPVVPHKAVAEVSKIGNL